MNKSISLFSGALGLDLGLEKAGIKMALCQDFDEACCQTMAANGRSYMAGDIRAISSKEILAMAGMKRGEPFLICGGPPCQPFSTAGKRLGIHDPRGSLFMDYVRMVDEIRPRFFVFENVKGLVSAPVDKGGKKGEVFAIILKEFAKIGYKTVHGVLDAVSYGVPQFRERTIILGSRDGESLFLPIPTHHMCHQRPEMLWRTLASAIKDLEGRPGPCGKFSPERLRYLRMVKEGQNWRSLPPEVAKEAMGGAWESGGGKVGFYRRLSYAEPSPTLVTSPVQKATILCHPKKDRPLSVREYARLQQFPDDWKIAGTVDEQYRQLGNAVPVGLAEAIGEALLAVANGGGEIETKRIRGTSVHKELKNGQKRESKPKQKPTPGDFARRPKPKVHRARSQESCGSLFDEFL